MPKNTCSALSAGVAPPAYRLFGLACLYASDRFQDDLPLPTSKNPMKHTTIAGALLVTCSLAGCTWRNLRNEVRNDVGGNVDTMIQQLGAPDLQADIPGDPPRVAYTWRMRNKSGSYVCNVNAISDKNTGHVISVSDNCPNYP